jgi:glycosyltransferase involved in cell wall biosynthesis
VTSGALHTLQLGMGWVTEQPGGLNRYYADLIRALTTLGVEVTGLVAGSSEVSRLSGGRVRAFSPIQASLPHRLIAVRRECAAVLSAEPGILPVAHFALYALPCLDLWRGRPLIAHFHGPWALEGRTEGQSRLAVAGKFAVERQVLRRATACIALSRAFAAILENRYRVPAGRIHVIPGGVDCDRFAVSESRDEARRRLGWPTDRPIVLVLRRLVRRMGLEDLIDAVALARARVPELLLLVGGSGRLADELQARVSARGLASNVRLLGRVPEDDLARAYRAATVTVVPTVALEGFGLVAAESLAAGTPVLVTPVGGLPEVLQDLAPELVLPGTGPAVLAEGLSAALSGGIRLPDETRCADFARARYHWPTIAARVRDVYAGVAS